MSTILNLIKQAGLGAVEAGNPVQLLFGEVVSAAPFRVQVDQRFTLPPEFLIMPESLSLRGLQQGDKLILLRMQGGQRYLLVDKVVNL
ncbi:DUF2577 domain-containing protein [Paenibacillus chungangensis]|uniref:DUF2577 domain-containing protein n=1 Tax=Paenibacillus chungangensis TaxID=696535 RepID=A0ABW3HQN6_9BACL